MKAQNDEGESLHRLEQGRDEAVLADPLDRHDDLELRDRIDPIDDIQPLDTVVIPWVHRVHTQVSWLAVGLRAPTLADGHTARAGRLMVPAPIDDTLPMLPLPDQPCQLRPRVAGDLPHEHLQQPLVGPLEDGVVELA